MRIYDSLLKYKDCGIYPFHMPGHKRNTDFLKFGAEPTVLDVTEVFGMDNLQNPSGIILETERKAAKVFGADESYLLANGSTGGVISAILAQSSGQVMFGRNSHMSAYSAVILGNLEPVYVYPPVSPDGIAGPISPNDVKLALSENPNADTVFITSPTYEGIVSDISEIAKISHYYNAVLIVDEAHGAHLNFHEAFPQSAISSGADIVINSLHKTLPSLTQTALLHVKGQRVNKRLLRMYLNMVNSSSPSYILLSSIDKCINLLENKGDLFNRYVDRLNGFYERVSRTGFRLINEEYLTHEFISCNYKAFDKSKLVIMTDGVKDIDAILRERYKIEIESATDKFIIAMTSIADTDEGFDRLINALEEMSALITVPSRELYVDYPKAAVALKPSEAVKREAVPKILQEACGCISAGFITPYPPGIPAIIPGEIINHEIINFLPPEHRNKEVYIIK